MVFTRKLLVVLVSVWLLATAISWASVTKGSPNQVPQEAVEDAAQDPVSTLPAHVRLASDSKEFIRRYSKAAEYTGLAVGLVRDHLNHLFSGNFDAARKNWHPKGHVLHLGGASSIVGTKTLEWSDDQPLHRSAVQYIDILEKYRQDGQRDMFLPPQKDGPWIHPFSAVDVTVLHISTSGVLISVDQSSSIDLGEPVSLDNPGFFGDCRGYRSMLFMVQVGYVQEGNQGFDPESGIAKSDFKVRLHHVSLAPIPGC